MSKQISIVSEFLKHASEKGVLTKHPSSALSSLSSIKGTPKAIRGWLELSARGSRASLSPHRATTWEVPWQMPITEICGQKLSSASPSSDPHSFSSRTSQPFEQGSTTTSRRGSFRALPESGTMRSGQIFLLKSLELPHEITECGCLHGGKMWLRPCARDYKGRASSNWRARTVTVKGLKVPRAPSVLPDQIGGVPNPRFSEWIMGLPKGWASSERLATVNLRKWLRSHGLSLQEKKKNGKATNSTRKNTTRRRNAR